MNEETKKNIDPNWRWKNKVVKPFLSSSCLPLNLSWSLLIWNQPHGKCFKQNQLKDEVLGHFREKNVDPNWRWKNKAVTPFPSYSFLPLNPFWSLLIRNQPPMKCFKQNQLKGEVLGHFRTWSPLAYLIPFLIIDLLSFIPTISR